MPRIVPVGADIPVVPNAGNTFGFLTSTESGLGVSSQIGESVVERELQVVLITFSKRELESVVGIYANRVDDADTTAYVWGEQARGLVKGDGPFVLVESLSAVAPVRFECNRRRRLESE